MTRPTDAEMAEWERGINRSLDGVPMRARLKEMFSALVGERERADRAVRELSILGPRTIHTPEELDELPTLSVVLFSGILVMQRAALDWFAPAVAEPVNLTSVAPDAFYALVLWTPGGDR